MERTACEKTVVFETAWSTYQKTLQNFCVVGVKSFFLGPSLERQRGWHDSQFYGPGLEHVQKDALVLRNRKLPKMAFR